MNGALIGTVPDARVLPIPSRPFSLGGANELGPTFKGRIDEGAVYDKALSDARVRLHDLRGRLSVSTAP